VTADEGGLATAGPLALEPQTAASVSGTVVLMASKGSHQTVVTDGAMTFDATTGFPDGALLELFVVQGASAPDTATFSTDPGGFIFPAETSSALSGTVEGQIDYFRFIKHNSWFVCSVHYMYEEP
jgi:hypothetical protein